MNGGETIRNTHIKPHTEDSEPGSIRTAASNHTYTSFATSRPTRLAADFSIALLVVAVPLSVHAGLLDRWFAPATAALPTVAEVQVTQSLSAVDAPVLAAAQNADPTAALGGAELVAEDGALIATGPVGEDEIATSRRVNGEISVHTVRPCTEQSCETLSHIAEMYGVTVNTILWANDIDDPTTVQPGQTLVILPISGVQHEVQSGESISDIAKKYDGDVDEILAYNQITEAATIAVGDTLTIPGGTISTPPARIAAAPVKTSGARSGGGFSHPVPGAVKTQGIHGYNAVDLAAPAGTPIRAAAAGEVIVSKGSGWNGGYGNYIVVRHPGGAQTLYAHNSRNVVGVGAYVSQGEVIGYVGSTGRSTGDHVHFEVRGAYNPF